jgi:hypothetical protein
LCLCIAFVGFICSWLLLLFPLVWLLIRFAPHIKVIGVRFTNSQQVEWNINVFFYWCNDHIVYGYKTYNNLFWIVRVWVLLVLIYNSVFWLSKQYLYNCWIVLVTCPINYYSSKRENPISNYYHWFFKTQLLNFLCFNFNHWNLKWRGFRVKIIIVEFIIKICIYYWWKWNVDLFKAHIIRIWILKCLCVFNLVKQYLSKKKSCQTINKNWFNI